jgi:hypothetical protein
MSKSKNISVWFFTGVLLAFYGIVILGYGLFGATPTPRAASYYLTTETAVWVSRAPVWWGAFLLVFGTLYSIKFFPKDKE